MKTLVKATALSGLVTVLALSRLIYVRSQGPRTKDAIVGDALEPINMLSALALYGFGFLTAALLVACLVGYIIYLFGHRPSQTHATGDE